MPATDLGQDDFPPCNRCGQIHARVTQGHWVATCSAHRTNGAPCMKFPAFDTNVCERHGAGAPHVQRAAADRAAAAKVQKRTAEALVSLGVEVPDDVDPIQEMLNQVWLSSRAVAWLGERVAELTVPDTDQTAGEDILGMDEEGNIQMGQARGQLYGPDNLGNLALHPLYKEWNRERERLVATCKKAVDAGVSERLVRIAETQGRMIVEAVEFALNEVGLEQNKVDEVKRLIAIKFRELDSRLGIAAIPTTAIERSA